MNYAKVRSLDISNGPGQRVSVFFQGCSHHCKNCFNPETWNPNYGSEWNKRKRSIVLDLCGKEDIVGLSLLGGDPLYWFRKENDAYYENRTEMLDFVLSFKKKYPNKTLWIWTGYTWEELMSSDKLTQPLTKEFIEFADVIVDGLFIEELKVPNLKWRGSTNQRIIDVKESIRTNTVVLYE